MKTVKIERAILQSSLEIAGRFAGKLQQVVSAGDESLDKLAVKEIAPSIAMIFTENNLEIRANDYFSSGVSLNIPIENQEEVSYFIPAKLLQETVSKSEDVVVSIGLDDEHLVVKSSMGRTSLKTLPEEIPTLPAKITTHSTEITGAEFSHALSMVAFATQKKDADCPSLAGVRFVLEDDNDITLIATDGIRLAKFTTHLGWKQLGREEHEKAVTVPIKAVNSLVTAFSKIDTTVKIGLDKNRIAFQWDGGYLFTSLVQDNYPDWKAIYPKEYKTKITFSSGFQNAIKACAIMAKGMQTTTPVISVDANNERTLLKSKSDIGESVVKLIPDKFDGKDLVVGFDGDLIPRHVPGEITLSLNSHNTAVLFSATEDPSWEYLLMPGHLGS